MDNIIDTPFWLNDPNILLKNYYLIFPNNNMMTNQYLNTLTRLSILILIMMVIFKFVSSALIIPVLFIIIIIMYYYQTKKSSEEIIVYEELNEGLNEGHNKGINNRHRNNYRNQCRKPSFKNPMMNHIQTDYNTGFDYDDLKNITLKGYNDIDLTDDERRNLRFDPQTSTPIPCNSDDEVIQDNLNFRFSQDMYKDFEEVYDKKNSQRQFFTIPHYIPNDQEGFGKYLYDFPPTCKEDQSRCLRYQEYRVKYPN